MGEEQQLLRGIRVLEIASGIAGPYCAKLFVGAGADVVKVEPPGGDPFRHWSGSGDQISTPDGALFSFLSSGKRSVDPRSSEALAEEADLLIDDGSLSLQDIERMQERHPRLTVVSITHFGRTGPWADQTSSEFLMQALGGSCTWRGEPDREPLQAGGRLGEFVAGGYAAVAALSVLCDRHSRDRGEFIDVSILESLCITMGGGASAVDAGLGAPQPVPLRHLELPSVVKAADDFVGFCLVTAQQFKDFLVMIEHPELTDDDELLAPFSRLKRRGEFEALVNDWIKDKPVADVVELASAMRIPVTPVGTPETIATIDHFVDRSVYSRGADDRFDHPRRPYLINGAVERADAPSPKVHEHADHPRWLGDRPPPPPTDRVLQGVKVVDFTAFVAGPTASVLLGTLGADVIKIESIQRPDGMRLSRVKPIETDCWWEYPGGWFQPFNVNKRDVTLNLGSERGLQLVIDLIKHCDVVIENFTPRVLDNFGITWELLQEVAPHVTLVRMPAFGLGGPWRDRSGLAQTMEQVSGLAWMTGYEHGDPIIPRGICDPNAGIHTAFATLCALNERARTGVGQLVECPMVESALNIAADVVLEHSAYGLHLERHGNRGPDAAPQGIYACRGTERWVALAVATDDQWRRLRTLLGDPEWSSVPDLDHAKGRRALHDQLDEKLSEWISGHDRDDLLAQLSDAGVPAARVAEKLEIFDNPQFRARGFLETIDRPYVGEIEIFGMPFRFSSKKDGWVARPAPTLGQHNDEVLMGILGLSKEECDELRQSQVIGERLLGY